MLCCIQAQATFVPSCGIAAFGQFDPVLEIGRDCTALKHKEAISSDVQVAEWNGEHVELSMDSNKLHYDFVEDVVQQTGHTKRQRDVENENLKRQIVDLEQCHDSSLSHIESFRLSGHALMPSVKHLETRVKRPICEESETSLKNTLSEVPSKHVSSTHEVDLSHVEAPLEKGSLEAQMSEKKAHEVDLCQVKKGFLEAPVSENKAPEVDLCQVEKRFLEALVSETNTHEVDLSYVKKGFLEVPVSGKKAHA